MPLFIFFWVGLLSSLNIAMVELIIFNVINKRPEYRVISLFFYISSMLQEDSFLFFLYQYYVTGYI